MYQLLQTMVKLPGTSNHMSCRVQHLMQLVSDSLWSPSENDVAVVDSRHHKGVHQCHSRLRTQCTSDMVKLTKMVEAGCADLRDMFLEAEWHNYFYDSYLSLPELASYMLVSSMLTCCGTKWPLAC